ncbi:MAG: DUF1929 domain-containing protein [Oligoflexus sp.]|nr:DUF1929 domain-containing protein [Oligoflexus sp.]
MHVIRLSSDTHSFNSGQHIVPLTYSHNREQHSLETQIPLSMDLAPPSFYLLCIVNKDGVPSLGKTVRLLSQGDEKPATEIDDALNGEQITTK